MALISARSGWNKSALQPLVTNGRKSLSLYSKDDEYQYLHRSKIPTMHFQDSLPRLPIPKLEKTCEKYLAAQRPLLIDEAYRKTEANVKRFQSSSGKQLQERLVLNDNANKHTSYISGPWFDMYLKDRQPLPINYNPILVHIDHPNELYNDQLIKATNLLISSLRFLKSFRANILRPEVYYMNPKTEDKSLFAKVTCLLPKSLSCYGANAFKSFPLDMSQFGNLFNSTRIPEIDKDMIVQNTKGRHICVMKRGHFYVFDVLDKCGNILPAAEIHAKLKMVMDDPRPPADFPVGILTTENRNTWAMARHNLFNLGNDKPLRQIDSAIFNLVLDDAVVRNSRVDMVRNFLHSDGTNRWFDKSFSLIVTKDGVSGINFEHSWGDGVAVLRFFREIYEDSVKKPRIHPDTAKPEVNFDLDDVKCLDFNLNDQLKAMIKTSCENYKKTVASLDVNVLLYDGLGKTRCKTNNISPDSLMQLGFQSAYFKYAGKYTATYESCSTSAFKHGRTETIRPCTMATKDFCDSLHLRKSISKQDLLEKIKKCSKVHSKLTMDAAMGKGFDRHLFGLKYTADKYGLPTPTIFSDLSYEALNHNILSTSTLSSPLVAAGGFGPVVTDGFGIGYTIADQLLGTVVTSYKGQQDGKKFVENLQESYEEFKNILNEK